MYTCERPSTTYFELLIHISCKSVVLTLNTHLLWAATEGLKLSKASDWSFDRSDQKLAESHMPHHQIFPQTFFRYLRTLYWFCGRFLSAVHEVSMISKKRKRCSLSEWNQFDRPPILTLWKETQNPVSCFWPLGQKEAKGDRWGTSYYVHRCKANLLLVTWNLYLCTPCSLRAIFACVVCKFWPSELNAMEFIPSGDRHQFGSCRALWPSIT